MRYCQTVMATVLFLGLFGSSLAGCAPAIKANGGIAVEAPPVPNPDTAMDSDVAILLARQSSVIEQCNANFE